MINLDLIGVLMYNAFQKIESKRFRQIESNL